MFSIGRHLISRAVRNHVRKYNADLRPVLMKHIVFEGTNTDSSRSPIIIMHGLYGSKRSWKSVARVLQSKINRKIISVDARNHGESPHTESHGTMHMTADLLYLMQLMNINKANLIGHCMGGRVMMYMALKHPHLVERAVIVDMSPMTTKHLSSMKEILFAMKNVQVPRKLSQADGRKYAETEIKKLIKDKRIVDFIMLNLKKDSDGSFKWACNVDAIYKHIRSFREFMPQISGLRPYQGAVMFICGIKSSFVSPESVPEIMKIFPKCEIHWMDTGHGVHFEQPVKFCNLVEQFLK